MTNRRTYQRFIVNSDTSLEMKNGIKKSILLKNFSSGGASVVIDRLPSESERVKLYLNVPAVLDKPVMKEAEMVWCRRIKSNSWELGLNFGINKVIIPRSLPKEESEKKPPAKKPRLTLWVVVFFVVTIIVGIIFFMREGALQIFSFPRSLTFSQIQNRPPIFARSQTITLRGISFDSRGVSFALINNQTVVVGDRIRGAIRVNKINRDSVELDIGGNTQILELNKSIVIKPK